MDVVLPKSWSLEKCYLTDRTVTEKRIPARDKTDILIHGKFLVGKNQKLKSYFLLEPTVTLGMIYKQRIN